MFRSHYSMSGTVSSYLVNCITLLPFVRPPGGPPLGSAAVLAAGAAGRGGVPLVLAAAVRRADLLLGGDGC